LWLSSHNSECSTQPVKVPLSCLLNYLSFSFFGVELFYEKEEYAHYRRPDPFRYYVGRSLLI